MAPIADGGYSRQDPHVKEQLTKALVEEGGREYYTHAATGRTMWEEPTPLPSGWSVAWDEPTSSVVFTHIASGETADVQPPALADGWTDVSPATPPYRNTITSETSEVWPEPLPPGWSVALDAAREIGRAHV
jgi:hypothetical protein